MEGGGGAAYISHTVGQVRRQNSSIQMKTNCSEIMSPLPKKVKLLMTLTLCPSKARCSDSAEYRYLVQSPVHGSMCMQGESGRKRQRKRIGAEKNFSVVTCQCNLEGSVKTTETRQPNKITKPIMLPIDTVEQSKRWQVQFEVQILFSF